MGFELRRFPVRALAFGSETTWSSGTLTLDARALARHVVAESGLRRLAMYVARPGESVRVVNVLDAIEPRWKPNGRVFPGFLGTLDNKVGRGVTHALDGCAILVCGEVPGMVASQLVSEALVDMSGPGAAYSPFAGTMNLVLHCDFFDEQGPIERVATARRAGLVAAERLAEVTRDQTPESVRRHSLEPARADLPRVVYVCPGMELSELHRTFLAGSPIGPTPVVVAPSQLMDGILVSGNYDIGSTRNPTYTYQRSEVVEELLARQTAGELAFPGVVVTQCLINGYEGKRRSAQLAAEAARLLGARGAVVSIEECGHAYVDLMLTCQALEDVGIDTVLLMAESSGADGTRAAALAFADGADALVSVGNMDEVVSLPAVERVLGGSWFRGRWPIGDGVHDAIETPLVNLFAATCQMGPGRLRAERA